MFKYYISEVEGGGGSRPSLISLMQGGGFREVPKSINKRLGKISSMEQE